jgi:menaquinone-specific isochorismate synthase
MSAIATPLPSDLRARELRQAALAAGRTAGTKWLTLSLQAPARAAEFLLELGLAAESSYFATPAGSERVGLGAARVLTAAGGQRFRSIRDQAEALFAELPSGSPVRLFGGFAFQPGRAQTETWRPFGEGRFVLPRLSYERSGGQASITLLLEQDELRDGRLDARLELASRVLAALEQSPVSDAAPAAVPAPSDLVGATLCEGSPETWRAQVRAIGAAIERGELEKLVLARRVDVELGAAISPALVLERLRRLAPECARFSFSTGGPTFLGATPERLVSKRGSEFETEAVAGTLDLGTEAPARLLESSKNRAEQAIVLRELLHDLEPLADSIEHRELPEIHVLKHVAHLRTRVRGTLNSRRHVLELVERLHPTPAVAGTPTERALAWIAEHEADERGWYAGPVGWFDGQGDGDFVVALRSGVLGEQHLALYAGAGIVRGSEADDELAETRWKLAALLGALGVPA